MGFDGLRPQTRPTLHRRRQWQPVESRLSQPRTRWPRRGQQSLSLEHRRDPPRYRRICLALPDHAGRNLGLHRHPAHHPRRHRDRWRGTKGADAGAQERLLLRARPRDRRIHLGRGLYPAELGFGDRCPRAPDPEQGGAGRCHRRAGAGDARSARRAQLAPDGVSPWRRAGLYPCLRGGIALRPRGGLEARPRARLQRRFRSGRGRSAARSGHPPRGLWHGQGQAAGLGSRQTGSALGGGISRPVERRAARHRRGAGVPGQFLERIQRLRRRERQQIMEFCRTDRDRRPADHLHRGGRAICRGAGWLGRRLCARRRWRVG